MVKVRVTNVRIIVRVRIRARVKVRVMVRIRVRVRVVYNMPYRRARAWPSGCLGRVRAREKVYYIQGLRLRLVLGLELG